MQTRFGRLGMSLLALLVNAGAGLAGQPYEALDAGDVFVATITAVEDRGATHGQPPVVRLKVLEVIRGDAMVIRSPAVWLPPFHGIDYGNVEEDPAYLAWVRKSYKGPKIGEKLILGGQKMDEKHRPTMARAGVTPVYQLFDFVRIPYTDKAKANVVQRLKDLEEWHRAQRKKDEDAAAALIKSHRDWQASIRDEDLVRMTAEAPLVVSVKVESAVHGGFTIGRWWKGRSPLRNVMARELRLQKLDPKLSKILDYEAEYFMFLSAEQELVSFNWVSYGLVHPSKGIVLVTKERQAIIEGELARLKEPPALPVIALTADEKEVGEAFRETRPAKHRLIVTGMGRVEREPEVIRKALIDAQWLIQVRTDYPNPNQPAVWNVHLFDLRESTDKPTVQVQWPSVVEELPKRAEDVVKRIESGRSGS